MLMPASMFRYGRRVAVAALLVLLFAGAMRQLRIFDPDLWWHLRTGQTIIETKSIPCSDIFSYTNPGREWVAHEWLSEIFIHAVYRVSSSGGMVIVFALVITLAFWVTYLRCETPPLIAGAALIVGALASMPTWGVRPQMLTLLLSSIFLFVLGNYTRGNGTGRLWWLVPLTALWANLHGGFVLGLVLIFLTGVGAALDVLAEVEQGTSLWRRLRPLCFVLTGCVLAGLLTPHGLRLYSYPLETIASHAQQTYIAEWRSPNFQQSTFLPLAFLILATFSALALSPKRVRLSELLLLTAMCYMALRSGRHIPFLSLVAVPLLAEHTLLWAETHRWGRTLAAPERPSSGTQIIPNVVLLLLPTALAIIITSQVVTDLPTTEATDVPVAAVDYVQSHQIKGPIYNTYSWGGYLIWRLYPEHRVYIDGRADVYGDNFFDEFVKIYRGVEGWREPFDRYGVRTVLIEPRSSLATSLRQQSEWEKVFEDDKSVVFIK